MIHIDIKKLGVSTASATASPATVTVRATAAHRLEFVHVASTPPRASLFSQIMPNEQKESATAF